MVLSILAPCFRTSADLPRNAVLASLAVLSNSEHTFAGKLIAFQTLNHLVVSFLLIFSSIRGGRAENNPLCHPCLRVEWLRLWRGCPGHLLQNPLGSAGLLGSVPGGIPLPCAPSGSPWKLFLRISHFGPSLFRHMTVGVFCASSGLLAPPRSAASLRRQVPASSFSHLWAVLLAPPPLSHSRLPRSSAVSPWRRGPAPAFLVFLGCRRRAPVCRRGPGLQPVPGSFPKISAVVVHRWARPFWGASLFHAPLLLLSGRGLLGTFFLFSQAPLRRGSPEDPWPEPAANSFGTSQPDFFIVAASPSSPFRASPCFCCCCAVGFWEQFCRSTRFLSEGAQPRIGDLSLSQAASGNSQLCFLSFHSPLPGGFPVA